MFDKGSAVALVAATAVVVGAIPASAQAATIVGSNFDGNLDCDGPSTYFQEATAAGSPSYRVPAGGGVITSWSTQQGVGLSAQAKLGVLHPTGTANEYTTSGSSGVEVLDSAALQTFPTRLPAHAGDTIAVLIVSGTYDCARNGFDPLDIAQRDDTTLHDAGNTFTYSDDNNEARINIAASVEPDADGDGYGDETQDGCVGDSARNDDCVSPQTTLTKDAPRKTDKSKVKLKFVSIGARLDLPVQAEGEAVRWQAPYATGQIQGL